MNISEFDTASFGVNTWVTYAGRKQYVIAISFPERLFALIDKKCDLPADQWSWVRCENVSLHKSSVVPFPAPTE
jgi:hypothetical protein